MRMLSLCVVLPQLFLQWQCVTTVLKQCIYRVYFTVFLTVIARSCHGDLYAMPWHCCLAIVLCSLWRSTIFLAHSLQWLHICGSFSLCDWWQVATTYLLFSYSEEYKISNIFSVRRWWRSCFVDEYSWSIPQQTGDIFILLSSFLQWSKGEYWSLPRNAGRSSAGDRTRVQWSRYRLQMYV